MSNDRNEANTKADLIEPRLKLSGWGQIEDSKIHREYYIAPGKVCVGRRKEDQKYADYVLIYKGKKLAVVEAKSVKKEVAEGVAQAKEYAAKLHIDTTFSTNGLGIYQICMKTGKEELVDRFPTPEQLWDKSFGEQNHWQDIFDKIPLEDKGGTKIPRFYQEIAISKVLDAVAKNQQRILLTLATGTGKTFVAFQIAWKLFQARWNLKRDGNRRPRILFLADRNILANQAYNDFTIFPDDALVRISPKDIRKKGGVPTSGSVFFTIFQTFMSGDNDQPYFGEYPRDFFDFVIVDECHRGGANDESTWRGILEYFSPAVQLGLTATPKRRDNVDTYRYFGEPVYVYSLREGVNDGFLTPFKIKRINTTLDEYMYTPDDDVVEGQIEEGKLYREADFNKIIEIKEREAKRVKIVLNEINQNEKTIIFCATQDHALAVRDLVNQFKKSTEPNYCVRVTANDGLLGEQYLSDFQDNENIIPTILTTSQKLSTGVDARNVRNIVLMRPINSMIEFKQIIGRGTRLFDNKYFFTIYDFVNASHLFADQEWDGDPLEPETHEVIESIRMSPEGNNDENLQAGNEIEPRQKIKIKLRDGREREIQYMISTSLWGPDGRPISAEELFQNIYGILPDFYKSEEDLRNIWSEPATRKALLEKLSDAGYGKNEMKELQKIVDAEKSDLFDVLEFISYSIKPITRETRVADAQNNIFTSLEPHQKEFLEFVLSKYIEAGVEELEQEKLPNLLKLKYNEIEDAQKKLGGIEKIVAIFIGFQKRLYQKSDK